MYLLFIYVVLFIDNINFAEIYNKNMETLTKKEGINYYLNIFR